MGTDETPIMPPSRSPAIRPAGETSTQLLRRNRSPLETSFFSRKTPPSSGLLTSTMERHAVKETELWKGQAARLTDELAREKRDAEYFRDKVAVLEEQLKVLNDKLNENFLCRSAATGAPSVPDMLKSQLSYQEENIELKVEIEEAKKKIQELSGALEKAHRLATQKIQNYVKADRAKCDAEVAARELEADLETLKARLAQVEAEKVVGHTGERDAGSSSASECVELSTAGP
ncbi:MAG: hypothetical protein KVP17_001695 [Porospora cf. gigantea B]|uniref:uncharacterized protein n=1 Tax=Porospora cf. gigantea B TaxID=2853592 RepID=UPI003571EE18|nr:MAG: hypothetical protein KVP17_001695 [Porospora cf. gigantea B]